MNRRPKGRLKCIATTVERARVARNLKVLALLELAAVSAALRHGSVLVGQAERQPPTWQPGRDLTWLNFVPAAIGDGGHRNGRCCWIAACCGSSFRDRAFFLGGGRHLDAKVCR